MPAREGTLRVLHAARDAGARRVVLDLVVRRHRLHPQGGDGVHRARLDRP